MAVEYETLVHRSRVLGSMTRLDVWTCIGDHGMFSTDIGRTLGLAAATVSYHLGVLENAGLIKRKRLGRNVLCTLTGERWGVVSEAEVEAMMTAPAG